MDKKLKHVLLMMLVCLVFLGPTNILIPSGSVHASVPPPWRISVSPDTVYIRPPHCSASFIANVAADYKDKPITILLDDRSEGDWTGPGTLISHVLYDGNPKLPSELPDYEAVVTIGVVSPWEKPAGEYRVRVYAYPTGVNPYEYDVYAILTVVIVDTGVKRCDPDWTPPPPSKCREGSMEILEYCPEGVTCKRRRVCVGGNWVTETLSCPTPPPPYDWWRWRWPWDWWGGWRWPWHWRGWTWWFWTGEQPFDFTLRAEPTAQTAKAGQSGTFTVNVDRVSGTVQPVALSLTGLPGGASYSFSPGSGPPRPICSLAMPRIRTDSLPQENV